MRLVATGLCLGLALAFAAAAEPEEVAAPAGMTADDHANLVRNLRWILARERAERARQASRVAARPPVAVLADAGAWHLGARSIVAALEADGIACRVVDASLLVSAELEGAQALVLPGGWAPYQNAAAGEAGLAAIRDFVERGGRCLGICAGAFMLSRSVAWEGAVFPYPLGLFDGTAEGPVAGLAPWPARAGVRLDLTDAGRTRGLAALAAHELLYYGGPRFLGGSGVEILARYPDATAAVVARRVGKGEVILVGPHVERPAPAAGGDDAPPPAGAGALLRALLRLSK